LKDASKSRKFEALHRKGNQFPARIEAGLRIEDGKFTVLGKAIRKPMSHGSVKEDKRIPVPVCRCLTPVTSLSTKELSNPVKPGKELLEGRLASERDGKSSVNSVGARLELHVIKEILAKVREEVDAGLTRIEAVIEDLEPSGPGLGLVEEKVMSLVEKKIIARGKDKAKAYSGPNGFQPSKKKTRYAFVAGPKPGRGPVTGPKEKEASRVFSGARSFQVGESSVAGESISAGTVRSASSSILGNYEWVHKALQAEVGCVDPGSSPKVVCEGATGMGVAAQGLREVDGSPQTAPVVMLGSHGEPSEPGATLASPRMSPVFNGNFPSGPAGAEQSQTSLKKCRKEILWRRYSIRV
jgi:hypothetical protein